MEPVIAIGTQSFEYLRENSCFYVDKTELIREWWENRDAVTLITRPRRFGKTLNLNMLDCFFSNQYAGRGDLFEGLSIWKEEAYRALQGTYPVIFLSFASIKGETYEAAREGIFQLIVRLYGKYDHLKRSGIMTSQDMEYFDSVSLKMTDTTAAFALYSLSDYLYRYYGKKVLIFLDEYDTPLQEAYMNGFWDKMVGFVRSLFNSTFKTNPFMERGLMTGITRLSKESIFSDLNNLTVVTTTSEKYCRQFGFTQEEVFQALDERGMGAEKDKVKEWYDGFTFGSQTDIYNPWSITGFMKEKIYKPYWVNSSTNSLINSLIRQGSPQVKMLIEDLMEGKTLTTRLDEEIIFDQLGKKQGAIWSMFLASGYLKVVERVFKEESGSFLYTLELTNKEVMLMFRNMIHDWFAQDDVPYNEFIRALLQDDIKSMNIYMNQVAKETFSFFDTGGKASESAPERFYHGFVLGLIAELAGKYRITSNRESGYGRYDVMMEPCSQDGLAFVLEFKVYDPKEERTLQDTLQKAHAQMEAKAYDTELTARGIPEDRIRHYGFAFEGKNVLIG